MQLLHPSPFSSKQKFAMAIDAYLPHSILSSPVWLELCSASSSMRLINAGTIMLEQDCHELHSGCDEPTCFPAAAASHLNSTTGQRWTMQTHGYLLRFRAAGATVPSFGCRTERRGRREMQCSPRYESVSREQKKNVRSDRSDCSRDKVST